MTITKVWGGANIVRGHFRSLPNGEEKFVHSKYGGELYAIPRDPYTRSKPYPEHIDHFKALPREKTAIIQLRRLGSYSINQLSKASGRSTSWIHKILNDARRLGLLRKDDNRKLPRKAILLGAKKKLFSCFSAFKLWESFILGEGDEPP